jgi:ribose 5-phosphate isomerase B
MKPIQTCGRPAILGIWSAFMKIAIGSDHLGYTLKESIKTFLANRSLECSDFGVMTEDPMDYPVIAKEVGRAVAKNEFGYGILICGTGVGMSIAANKIKKIRAVVCSEPYSAKMARAHNDANVLCLGSLVIGPGLVEEILNVFLSTDFEGGRHAARIKMLDQ